MSEFESDQDLHHGGAHNRHQRYQCCTGEIEGLRTGEKVNVHAHRCHTLCGLHNHVIRLLLEVQPNPAQKARRQHQHKAPLRSGASLVEKWREIRRPLSDVRPWDHEAGSHAAARHAAFRPG